MPRTNGNLDSGIDAGTPRGPRPRKGGCSRGQSPFLVIEHPNERKEQKWKAFRRRSR
nr:MAG TPA: hypothetical protein [Caudoviricetes sp.]